VFVVLAFGLRGSVWGRVFVCLAFAAVGAGLWDAEVRRENAPERIRVLYDSAALVSGAPVEIEGIVTGSPERSIDGDFLTLRSERLSVQGEERSVDGDVRVFVPRLPADAAQSLKFAISDPRSGQISNLKYGSRVRFPCALEREDEFLNPGVQRRPEVLDRMGVDATCTAAASMIETLSEPSRFNAFAWVYNLRAKLIDSFRDNLTPRAGGVMIASLLGDKYFLDKDTADLYREGGTFHILVISGLHITFIGGLLLWLVRWLTRKRWIHFTAVTAVLWAYTLAVGADTPVVRASVMFTIFLLGYALYRQSSLLNSLGICAVVLLVWKPSSLFDPSFQLTFVSVGAIVGCAFPLVAKLRLIGTWSPTPEHPFPPTAPRWLVRVCETIYWNSAAWRIEQKRNVWTAQIGKSPLFGGRIRDWTQKLVRWLFEGLLVSSIVQIWMLPLSVWYFHRVAFSGVVLNLWVSFWIAIESFASVIGVVLSNVSGLLAMGFFGLADAANWVLLLLPRAFSDNGWTSFRLPAYHGAAAWVYLVYYLPLLTLAVLLTRWDPFKLRARVTSLTSSPRLTSLQLCGVTASAVALTLVTVVVAH
jgi:competence protein ComEC